jgi:hypothetical protein
MAFEPLEDTMTDDERKLLIVIACTVLRLHKPGGTRINQLEHEVIVDALMPFKKYIDHMKDNA